MYAWVHLLVHDISKTLLSTLSSRRGTLNSLELFYKVHPSKVWGHLSFRARDTFLQIFTQ